MDSIEEFTERYDIKKWTIRDQGGISYIDVDGTVNISNVKLSYIPYPFGIVSGNFNCHYNDLVSLKNSPIEIGKNLLSGSNLLTNLKHMPVCNNANFYNCYITSIDIIPCNGILISDNPAYSIYVYLFRQYDGILRKVEDITAFFDYRVLVGKDLYIDRFINYLNMVGCEDDINIDKLIKAGYKIVYG